MSELNPEQLIAIAHLANGATTAEAAAQCKVAERTLYRWLQKPEFKRELRRVVSDYYHNHLTRLQGLLSTGIERMKEILEDSESQPSDLLKCVHLLLNAAGKLNANSIEERLSEVEAILEESGELRTNE